jgi:16S rRNA (uracil1498-N3)-methyltransferase
LHRFFIEDVLSARVLIKGQDAYHIRHVLRMRAGERVTLVDGQGKAALAEIECFEEAGVVLCLSEEIPEQREAPVKVHLAQALPKGDKMDWIVQKAVELGVDTIYPVETAHCVVQYDWKKKTLKQERWQKIAAEAAKQCKRSRIPRVEKIQTLDEFLVNCRDNMAKILLYEGVCRQGMKTVLQSLAADEFLLLVGPEGGFSASEAALCREHGMEAASAGPRILRTETAGLAGITMIMYEYGDLGG